MRELLFLEYSSNLYKLFYYYPRLCRILSHKIDRILSVEQWSDFCFFLPSLKPANFFLPWTTLPLGSICYFSNNSAVLCCKLNLSRAYFFLDNIAALYQFLAVSPKFEMFGDEVLGFLFNIDPGVRFSCEK